MATYTLSESGALKRIRTPHEHDVLSGRGGGINSHPGNKTFREWVKERKQLYNLAPSKAEKARVAKEVIGMVEMLIPPGRFLQKESSSGLIGGMGSWWVEVDETKAMAKTSQALREGAPHIRAAHTCVEKPFNRSTAAATAAATAATATSSKAHNSTEQIQVVSNVSLVSREGQPQQIKAKRIVKKRKANELSATVTTSSNISTYPLVPYSTATGYNTNYPSSNVVTSNTNFVHQETNNNLPNCQQASTTSQLNKQSYTSLPPSSFQVVHSSQSVTPCTSEKRIRLEISSDEKLYIPNKQIITISDDEQTPPLVPIPASLSMIPRVDHFLSAPQSTVSNVGRGSIAKETLEASTFNSLSLPDMHSNWCQEKFVNPFEDESDIASRIDHSFSFFRHNWSTKHKTDFHTSKV